MSSKITPETKVTLVAVQMTQSVTTILLTRSHTKKRLLNKKRNQLN